MDFHLDVFSFIVSTYNVFQDFYIQQFFLSHPMDAYLCKCMIWGWTYILLIVYFIFALVYYAKLVLINGEKYKNGFSADVTKVLFNRSKHKMIAKRCDVSFSNAILLFVTYYIK